jgi:tetratricopeptide (TPR) repeat protein
MTGNQERYQHAMDQGHTAAWDQDWNKAAAFYRQALEEHPEDFKGLTSLGLAMIELGLEKEAMQYYQNAAKNHPEEPLPVEKVAQLGESFGNFALAQAAYLRAAELYAKSRDLNKAVENWQRVAEINPSHLLAHSRLALVYEKTDRKAQAVSEYRIAAALLQKQGDLTRAYQTLSHALQLVPQNSELTRAMNMLKAGQQLPLPVQASAQPSVQPVLAGGSLLSAAAKAEEAEQMDPVMEASRAALAALAALLFEQDDQEAPSAQSSRRGFDALLRGVKGAENKNYDHTRIMLHLAQMVDYQSRQKLPEAAEELERALWAGLENAAAYFNMGHLQFQMGQVENAQQRLQKALPDPRYALGGQLLLGQIYEGTGELRQAALAYLEALRMADCQMVPEKQVEELQQIYDPLVEEQTRDAEEKTLQDLCQNIRELLLRKDWRRHLQQARQQLPKVDEDGPPVPLAEILTEARGSRLVEALGRIHQSSRMGLHRSAMEEAFQALQYAPTYLPLHSYMGELLVQQNHLQSGVEKLAVVAKSYTVRGDSKRAVSMYRRILELSPLDLEARRQLIEMLSGLGKHEEALNEYIRLAEAYYNMADLEMSRTVLNQALQMTRQPAISPAWKVQILHRLADLDLQSLEWRSALRLYEQIRVFMPEDLKGRQSLVELNFRLGQNPQALAELDNTLSYLWSNGQKNEAIQFVENILEEHGKQASIRRRLAELYRQVGRSADSVAQLDAAAEILVEAGDRAGAVEAIRTILALNPPNREDYQQVLAELKGS